MLCIRSNFVFSQTTCGLNVAVCLIAAVLFHVASPVALGQKTLTRKFTVGQKTNVAIKDELSMSFQGRETRTTQSIDMVSTVKVINTDGSADIDNLIQRIQVEFKSPSESFTIDSQSNEKRTGNAKLFEEGIKPLAGARFVAKTLPSGRLLDIAIPKEVSEKLGNKLPTGDGSLREIAIKSAPQFPEKPITVGETWTAEYEVNMMGLGKMVVFTTYQYLGEEKVGQKVLDKIKATTAVKIAESDQKSPLQLTKQNSDGFIWFDSNIGAIDHLEAEQDMEMSVNVNQIKSNQAIKTKLRMDFSPAR